MVINFRLIKNTRDYDDEMVFVMGSIPELGSWQSDQAPSMICIKPGLWSYALVVDKPYFESFRNDFQFTFFVAREHNVFGRTLLKVWNPSPSRYSMKRRSEVDELFIESDWNETAPQMPMDAQPIVTPMAYESIRQEVPASPPVTSVQGDFPQRISTPFAWYSASPVQKQVVENELVHEFKSEEIHKFEEELTHHEDIRLEAELFAREQQEQQLARRLELLRQSDALVEDISPNEPPKQPQTELESKNASLPNVELHQVLDEEEKPLLDDDALEKRSQNIGKPTAHEAPKRVPIESTKI